MLNCERNTRAMERKVRSAFREWSNKRFFETVYEHGQWWVRLFPGRHEDENMHRWYSVCDTNTGFDFELLG